MRSMLSPITVGSRGGMVTLHGILSQSSHSTRSSVRSVGISLLIQASPRRFRTFSCMRSATRLGSIIPQAVLDGRRFVLLEVLRVQSWRALCSHVHGSTTCPTTTTGFDRSMACDRCQSSDSSNLGIWRAGSLSCRWRTSMPRRTSAHRHTLR